MSFTEKRLHSLLAGFLTQQNSRDGELKQLVENLQTTLDSVSTRLDTLCTRFDTLCTRFDTGFTRVDTGLTRVDTGLTRVCTILQGYKDNLNRLTIVTGTIKQNKSCRKEKDVTAEGTP